MKDDKVTTDVITRCPNPECGYTSALSEFIFTKTTIKCPVRACSRRGKYEEFLVVRPE